MPPKNDIRLISINFKPYDLYNLFGIEQSHFVNTFNTPNTLFDKHESKILTKKLSRVYDTEEGIHIMETFLWNHKTKYRKYSILFDERVNRISEKKGVVEIERLYCKYSSKRYTEYYFKNNIGCSPKFFS